MAVIYHDELGIVYILTDGPVSFLDGFAYFTTIDGEDKKIKTADILSIGLA